MRRLFSRTESSTGDKGGAGATTPAARPPRPPRPPRTVVPLVCAGAGSATNNTGPAPASFPSNVVSTTKYNVLTFLPKNLFEQFKRVANVYFLIVLVLQYIPAVQPWSPTLAYLPLAVVVTASALKEAVEDYGRLRADREMNGSPCWVLDGATGNFVERRWAALRVGDIVRVPKNAPFPADILLLGGSLGFKCFVETKSLDGETNLKSKIGLPELAGLITTAALAAAQPIVQAEGPQGDIYSFLGSVSLIDETGARVERPLSIDQILLRGTVLKNTDHVIGLVLYTAPDTKIILNAGRTPSKRSTIDKTMNKQVFVILAILMVVCSACAIANYVWQARLAPGVIWNVYPQSNAFSAFLSFWTFIIIYSNFLPISIYISFEIVKLFQAFFISVDEDMYDEETDFYCLPRNWNISDELGQVEYLFSDKTGTLTENRMEFRSCYIGGKKYRNEVPKIKTIKSEAMMSLRKVFGEKVSPSLPDQHLYDMDLVNDVIKASRAAQGGGLDRLEPAAAAGAARSRPSPVLLLFGEAMSLCHSVQIDEKSLVFSSTSPDELALLNFARDLGFVFHGRGQSAVTVSLPGHNPLMYVMIAELAFTSERRRMSVIVRRPDGTNLVITKGADSVMLDRLADPHEAQEAGRAVLQFAQEGLRTLCYAYRELSAEQLQEWLERYKRAELSMDDRADQLARLSDEIERKLTFLGVTALEDRLQERVSQTIQLLRQAGIKVWVLTGDKQETAVSVGLSCKLLAHDSQRFVIDGHTHEEVGQQLREALAAVNPDAPLAPVQRTLGDRLRLLVFPESAVGPQSQLQRKSPTTIVFEGHAVAVVMADPLLSYQFAVLGTSCMSVICCRVAPKQKAQVVALVQRHRPHSVTLAIGDGANDVSMLQRAHVGVGIFGKEGRQAVNASDYAFSRFAFLQRLVLVHGHWNYVRSAHLALMIYYKNMVYVLPMLWFQYLCGYTGASLFQFTYNMFYNLLFTSLSPIVAAFYDQDIPAKAILAHPELFYGGITHKYFNFRLYWFHIGVAVLQSVVVFIVPLLAYTIDSSSSVPQGYSGDYLFELGTIIYVAIIVNVNFYVALISRSWPWFFQLTVLLSMGIFLPFLAIVGYGFSVSSGIPIYLGGLLPDILIQPKFYLTIALTVPLCQGLPFLLRYMRSTFYPTDSDIMREVYADRERSDPDRLSFLQRVNTLWQFSTNTQEATGKRVVTRLRSSPMGSAIDLDGVEHVQLADMDAPSVVVTGDDVEKASPSPRSNRKSAQHIAIRALSHSSDTSQQSDSPLVPERRLREGEMII